jgi:hypothetical protein
VIRAASASGACGYHILDQDLWGASGPVLDAMPGQVDLLSLLRGRTAADAADPMPLTIRLAPSSGPSRPDLVSYLLPLVSERLRAVLEAQRIDTIDYRQADLVDARGRVDRYWLANILGLVRGVDAARSACGDGDEPIGGFAIDPERADGARLFRLGELGQLVIVDDALREALASASLTGVRLRPTEAYDGY